MHSQPLPRRMVSPVIFVTGLAAWGCAQLWAVGQKGDDLSCAAAALLAVIAVKGLWVAMAIFDEQQMLKGLQRRSERASITHGAARWATRKDTKAAGMEDPSGLFLGTFKGRDLFYGGENSMLVLAPPGAGKTTSFAAQHLLRSNHSTIVLDPKLELYALTSKFREDVLRHRVHVISPWYASFAAQFGGRVECRDDGFDPCASLDPESSSVIDDCTLLASLLLPPPSKEETGSEDYWRSFSQEILVAFLLLELSRAGSVTLLRLRQMVLAAEEQLESDIAEMLTSDAFSGVLREYGARLYSPKMNSPKEWSGGLGGAVKALRLYDAHGPLGASVSKAGVDFRTFKDEPTTIYIAQPSDKVESHKGWSGMVITLAMEMLARDRRKRRCIFLLDEFQNAGVLIPILKGIALYRGTGLQFVFLVQFLSALKRLYEESWREFFSVDLVAAFGAPSDPETLKLLSELTGQSTVRDVSYSSDAHALAMGGVGVGVSSRETARPLMRPEEIRLLPRSDQLIFTANLPPICAKKQSYLDNPRLRRRASENPYYV